MHSYHKHIYSLQHHHIHLEAEVVQGQEFPVRQTNTDIKVKYRHLLMVVYLLQAGGLASLTPCCTRSVYSIM